MSKKEEKVSSAEDKKLSDEELENVSGGAVTIPKKHVVTDGESGGSDIVSDLLK